MRLDDLERRAGDPAVTTVTVDGFEFVVTRLTPIMYEAVCAVGRRRAETETPPEGLDLDDAAHSQVWRMTLIAEEIAAAAVTGWKGIDDDVTGPNLRRFIRLAPDKFANAIFSAARPAGLTDDEKVAAGNV